MRQLSVSVSAATLVALLLAGLCAEISLGGYHSHKAWKRRHGVADEALGDDGGGGGEASDWHSHGAYRGRHRPAAAMFAVETGEWWRDDAPLTEYQFAYTAQIATGYGPDVSSQRALTQLRAQVSITLEPNNPTARLQLFDVHVAQSHAEEVSPWQEDVLFMAGTESALASAELVQALALPLQFRYVNGRVGDIRFHVDDEDVKSRNVKRGLLQMLQLSTTEAAYDEGVHASREESALVYTAKENTIEGRECPCLYSVTNTSSWPLVEVVKTIDYGKCTLEATTSLERSSVYRYTVGMDTRASVGAPRLPAQPLSAMARVVLQSHYTAAPLLEGESPHMTTVTSKLVSTGNFTTERHEHSDPPRFRTSPEQLVYDASVEELKELFFLHGYEKFNGPLKPPFNDRIERAALALALLKEIEKELGREADGEGIEAIRTMGSMNRLVQLLRRCTMSDLRRLSADVKRDGSTTLRELFTNALALTRTSNTVTALVSQLKSPEGEMSVGLIPDSSAVQLLTMIAVQKGTRRTSEAMADSVLQLCQSPGDFRKLSSPVGSACWLAFGAVVGSIGPRLSAEKEAAYLKALVEHINRAESIVDKVVALKAMGNAGLASSWRKLQQLAARSSFLSVHAIEAMRKLPAESVWPMLAPITLDQTRPGWLRAHAFAALMRQHRCTNSSSSALHLDEIVGALAMDKSDEVKMFVREMLTAETESPPNSPNCVSDAVHLRSLAKLLQPVDSSRSHSMPAKFHKQRYEPSDGNGVELETIALYPRLQQLLPMHASLSLNTHRRGTTQRGVIELSLCTNGMDSFLREWILNATHTSSTSGGTSGDGAKNTLEGVWDRVKEWGGRKGSSAGVAAPNNAMALLSLRINNIDVAIGSLMAHGSSGKNEGSSGIKSLLGKFDPFTSSPNSKGDSPLFQLPLGFTRDVTVPSSVGAPIKVSQWTWLVGRLAANFTAQKELSTRYQIAAFIDVNLLQSQRMETCPIAHTGCSGVGSHRSFEFNGPLQMEAKVDSDSAGHGSQLQLAVKLPSAKTRVLGLHSIPFTYSTAPPKEVQASTNNAPWEKIRAIGSEPEDECEEEIDLAMSDGSGGTVALPLGMHGHHHWPKGAPEWAKWTKMLSSTENNLHIDYDPASAGGRAPQSFQLTVSTSLFRHSAVSSTVAMGKALTNLTSMHHQPDPFHNTAEEDSDENSSSAETPATRRQPSQSALVRRAINDQLAKLSRRTAYRHSVRSTLKAVGEDESQLSQWDAVWEAVCDSKLQACNTQLNLTNQHSPGVGDNKWLLSSRVAALRSELWSSLDDDDASGHYERLMLAGRVEFAQGPDLQWLDLKLLGEPPLAAADTADPMLSRYQLSVNYSLPASIPYRARTAFEAFRLANYWALKTKRVPTTNRQGAQSLNAQLSIDSVWKRYSNLSVQDGAELTLLRGWAVPAWLADTLVVRLIGQEHSIHSTRQLLTPLLTPSATSSSNTGERHGHRVCRINTVANGQLETFDGVVYNLPTSTKNCYSVMLGSCAGNNTAPDFKFSVQMRDISLGTAERLQRKALKVVTARQTIEIEPLLLKTVTGQGNTTGQSNGAEKLRISVNGAATFESDSSNLASLPANIEFQQAIGSQPARQTAAGQKEVVVVELEAQGLIVKFNGKTAKIYAAHHRSAACGLCVDYDPAYLNAGGDDEGQCGAAPTEGVGGEHGQTPTTDTSRFVEPIRRSKMIEFDRKICFSVRPVETCPDGSYPFASADETADEGNEDSEAFNRSQKVAFACLSRLSIESRRLRLVMRTKGIVHVNDFSVSFVENVAVPEKCVRT